MKPTDSLTPQHKAQVAKVCRNLWGVTEFNLMWTSEDLEQEAAIAIWKAEQRGKKISAEVLQLRVLERLRVNRPGGKKNKLIIQHEELTASSACVDPRNQLEARNLLAYFEARLTPAEKAIAYSRFVDEKTLPELLKESKRSSRFVRNQLQQIEQKAQSLKNHGNTNFQAGSK